MSCVYEIRCVVSGRSYVGKTAATAEKRWRDHQFDARKGSRRPFHCAIRKHGVEAFRVVIIEEGLTDTEAFDLERKSILALGTRTPNGYNATDGGEGVPGCVRGPMPDEVKAMLRTANLGKTHSKETREKLSVLSTRQWQNNPQSAESRQRIYEALRGGTHCEQVRENMSKGRMGPIPGITLDKRDGRYRARVRVKRGIWEYIGTFATLAEAQAAQLLDPANLRANLGAARVRSNSKSGTVGVYASPSGRWIAKTRKQHLGMFDTPEKARAAVVEFKAHEAYLEAKRRLRVGCTI